MNNRIKDIIRYAFFNGFYMGLGSYKEVLENLDKKPLSKSESEAYEKWEKETYFNLEEVEGGIRK